MSADRPRGAVFLTRALPPEPMAALRESVDLHVNPHDRTPTRAELLAGVHGCDALLSLVTDRIDAEVMDAAPTLRVISNYAVGYDNVDVAAASARGIPVTNTPDVLTHSTADMAFALLLAVARRVVEGHDLVRSRAWRGWEPLQLLGSDVSGATLGLVGLGRIGRAMIPRARGFGMDVVYWNRTRLAAEEEARLGATYAPLDEVLARARFASIHVASTPETHHLIGAEALERLGPGGYLINTARGPIVDEHALVEALERGTIAGAGLDVYEREPELQEGLHDRPNVVLAPHLGSATHETRAAMGMLAAQNLLAALRGERPRHVVNPEVLGGP
ncbi:MAG: D-glycerate dehydrogenase [Trueperaceae bacterium]|nr:D-glycerate dehydrogenase [Trueperaceae bacterium]